MSFNLIQSKIPGCFQVTFNQIKDKRGSFVKTYHEDLFKELNINISSKEEYFTYSVKNVFRGLHFQLPPKALDKVVYCVLGKVTDYVVDLRLGSPTYGSWDSFDLDGDTPSAVIIPIGLAHGFYVKSDYAMMQYKVSEIYDSKFDTGISYTTFDFEKDMINPILSDRDFNFSTIDKFNNPFVFER
jgi:dTDP-4-dehydrorhamnose 3,5-epimerase